MVDVMDWNAFRLDVGKRVWTHSGFRDHGPEGGPKIDVPPATGGTVVGVQKPDSTMDVLLYLVKWDTGQQGGHYLKELFCIGSFRTFGEFENALTARGREARLVLGPRGGFRRFTMEIGEGAEALSMTLAGSDQRAAWAEIVEPVLARAGIQVDRVREPV
jgi:hypothetical protein